MNKTPFYIFSFLLISFAMNGCALMPTNISTGSRVESMQMSGTTQAIVIGAVVGGIAGAVAASNQKKNTALEQTTKMDDIVLLNSKQSTHASKQ